MFMLFLVCTQADATPFTAVMSFFYLGALSCQVLGTLFEDNQCMRKLRMVAYIAIFIIAFAV